MGALDHAAIAALRLFAADKTLAFLWADKDEIITGAFGHGVSHAEPGQRLVDVLPVFHGLESDLAGLTREPEASLDLPNIAIVSRQTGPMQRLNVSVRWDDARSEFVILIAKALSRAAFEVEIQQQVRARRLAETMLLEQAEDIRATNVELARVNEDLADFARLITHDLKAPMRAMRYFTDDLETSLTTPDASDPSTHISRLRAQSRRMTGMLSGLLSYATVERKTDAVTTFASGELADQIVASLPLRDGDRVLRTGDWPTLTTIEALFDLVLRNLLENATRYASPSETPAVLLDGRQLSDAFEFHVCDTGPGIPARDRASIFNPFTRLETVDTALPDVDANTGMGLAIVKRAVEAVGGRIMVGDGTIDYPGARFCVRWPLDPA